MFHAYDARMIHFANIKSTSLILATLFLVSCSPSATHNQKELVSSIDLALVQESEPAKTFANLCMANNKSIPAIEELALETKWLLADDKDLEKSKLSKLRRKILEIPGGGGHFRETQTLLIDKSHEQKHFLNLMQKFNRQDKLVSTKCVLYFEEENHLPICTSVGKLLKRPPDSNSKFSQSNSQFIRWNIVLNAKKGSVRCDGMGTVETEAKSTEDKSAAIKETNGFNGTVVSLTIDRTSNPVVKKPVANSTADR